MFAAIAVPIAIVKIASLPKSLIPAKRIAKTIMANKT